MSSTCISKLSNPTIKYDGSDDDMVSYLTELWKSDNELKDETKTEPQFICNKTFDKVSENDEFNLLKFKKELSRVSSNLVFRGNFGAYSDKLEKEMSLTKKSIVLNKDSCKILYYCLNDLIRYNFIRDDIFKKIKYADIFIKHKSGDSDQPKNFRYLSNHSNIFKILDKFWTNSLINILERNKTLPDKNIVRNNFSREFSTSIRNLALEKLNNFHQNKKIVLLDIKKAFDNVNWNSLKELLTSNISRKVNSNFAKKIMKQYMFLNTKRVIKYNDNNINFSKSIATGLPSSTIVFSLLIEQIIFQWSKKENVDKLIINAFVDDMYLEFNDTKNSLQIINSLISYLEEYGLIINKDKTKTNIDSLPFSQINKSDCYLGLPFAKTKKEYVEECIKLFNNKYYKINIKEILEILKKEDSDKVKKEIIGFFNYKLYGLLNFGYTEINIKDILSEFNQN